MKTFRAFGPTLGKGKLSKKIIDILNKHIDKSHISKKDDYSSKLASQIQNEIKISNLMINKNLSKELVKNIKDYLKKSDIEKVKGDLSALGLVPEDWGGDTQMIPVSAKTGDGMEDLLESIQLVSELMELKTNHSGPAAGIVLESGVRKGEGAVATLLVQKGTLKSGDLVLVGDQSRKIRSIKNYKPV